MTCPKVPLHLWGNVFVLCFGLKTCFSDYLLSKANPYRTLGAATEYARSRATKAFFKATEKLLKNKA